jgi:hypothetical protein
MPKSEKEYMEALDLMSSRGNSKAARSKVNSCLKVTGFTDDEITLLRSSLVGSQCRIDPESHPILMEAFHKWDMISYTEAPDNTDLGIGADPIKLSRMDIDRIQSLARSKIVSLEYRASLMRIFDFIMQKNAK